MRVVAENWGPDAIIFPDLCGQPFVDLWLREEKGLKQIHDPEISTKTLSSPTLPNRFLSILPADDADCLAHKVSQEVQRVFKEICFAVKSQVEKVVGIIPEETWNNIWERQATNFVETYWAALPWEEDHKRFIEMFKSWCSPKQEPWEFDLILQQYEKIGYTPNIGTCYGKLYALTERGLGSRKTTRDFAQQIEPHFKCTMFGELEPVHLGEHSDFGKLRDFWNKSMLPSLASLRSGERLSAIGLTKRLVVPFYFNASKEEGGLGWEIETGFPSTSTVATSAFKQRILDSLPSGDMKLFELVQQYTTCVRSLLGDEKARSLPLPMLADAASCAHRKVPSLPWDFARLDGDWLFEESFNKPDLQRELQGKWKGSIEALETERKKTVEVLNNLLNFARKSGLRQPSRYYAVILMDGDNMGKWLAGEFAPLHKHILHPTVWNNLRSGADWEAIGEKIRPLNPSLHLSISKALRDYSLHTARKIVEEKHLGKLIYAGGDDVLAFVSLRNLLEVMRELRAFFAGALKGDGNEIDWFGGSGFIRTETGFQLTMGTEAKASMGVVIAHHTQDLGQVLNTVRSQEGRAKESLGRDAFSIALMKRSGGHESFGAKWYYEKEKALQVDSLECLIQWRDAFTKGEVSPKFAYVFRDEARTLSAFSGDLNGAIEKEVSRLFGRHLSSFLPKEEKHGITDRLLEKGLFRLFESGVSLEDLAKFLSLAAFLGREENR